MLTVTQVSDRFFLNWLGGANGFFGLYTAFITE